MFDRHYVQTNKDNRNLEKRKPISQILEKTLRILLYAKLESRLKCSMQDTENLLIISRF